MSTVSQESKHYTNNPRYSRSWNRNSTRLFGSKRGGQSNSPGKIEIYDEQESLPNINIPQIELYISLIRDIIEYPTYDVTLLLVDDEYMIDVNYESRGIKKPTDVLSFPFQDVIIEPGLLGEPEFDIEDYYMLGDIIIDVPYVIRRCKEDKEEDDSLEEEKDDSLVDDEELGGYYEDDRGVSGAMAEIYDPEERIKLLLVHGMLHLVGYDHIEDDDYELMVSKEEEVLRELAKRLEQ